MKIRSVGHKDGRTDRRIVAFPNFANAPKNLPILPTYSFCFLTKPTPSTDRQFHPPNEVTTPLHPLLTPGFQQRRIQFGNHLLVACPDFWHGFSKPRLTLVTSKREGVKQTKIPHGTLGLSIFIPSCMLPGYVLCFLKQNFSFHSIDCS